MKKIAVAILNYNGEKLLPDFLPSVVAHSPEADVVIIDNASTDGSIEFLKAEYPALQIIQLDKNLGYAGGYNQGLKFLHHEEFVLLNSDVEVTKDWLVPFIDFKKTNPDVGCLQPKILDYKNKSQFEYAGASGGFMDRDLFPFCRGRILSEIEQDTGQYDDVSKVFWASGAALFISSKLFHEAEGFDNDFFAHMEEIDLCWRLQNKGYSHYVIPQSTVYHLGGGTLSQQNSHKTYLNFRNNLFIITKNYQGNLFFKIFYRLILDGIAAIRFLLRREFNNLLAVAKAHFYFYVSLPSLLSKRRKSLPKHKVELHGVSSKSLIWSFFIKGESTFSKITK